MAVGNHLVDALMAAGQARRDDVFATLQDGTTVTFGEYFAGARKMAGALQGAGLEPGDRVAVQVTKSFRALQLYLGTIMAGGVFLPLNTGYTDAELDYFFENARPRIAVLDPERGAAPLAAKVFTLDAGGTGSLTDALGAEGDIVPRSADDLAAILYTSGTTGRPKGAMLSHGNLRSNSEVLVQAWGFTAEDVLIHALPIFHTHGLFVATNVALLSGASLRFLPAFNPADVLAVMPGATAMMGVPTFYTRLLKEPGLGDASKNMRLFVSGSAPLLAETHREWEAATGHRILERYGMTETNMIPSNPLGGERRAGTVGLPLDGVSVRIMDGGTPAEDGTPGVIEVKGPNVFDGYWEMPEKTAEDFREDGYFVTGDIAVRDKDGYISIVGRAKDLVISGGYNVYPKEVETVIDAVGGVLESAVIGAPHPDFGEGVVAVVVRAGEVTEEAIRAEIAPQLAKFKQPKVIAFADELPRNTMGKVQKNILREQFAGCFT